jgi:hypothetical protein
LIVVCHFYFTLVVWFHTRPRMYVEFL